jgi:late competence protein required for DNA uptake (superfamily II DNA/RNA helicase)
MKIELTMTELLLIIDMIKNGTEQDNEGDDSYVASDLSDSTKPKCTDCGSTDEVLLSATKGFNAYCKKCLLK